MRRMHTDRTRIALVILIIVLSDQGFGPRPLPDPGGPMVAHPEGPRLPIPIRQPYAETREQYERHLGLHACLAATGEYVGRVEHVTYGITGGVHQWSYTVRAPESPTSSVPARTWTAAATYWTVTAGKCADGRP
jgi:hypothetical protein